MQGLRNVAQSANLAAIETGALGPGPEPAHRAQVVLIAVSGSTAAASRAGR
jgi:hypothetical protein